MENSIIDKFSNIFSKKERPLIKTLYPQTTLHNILELYELVPTHVIDINKALNELQADKLVSEYVNPDKYDPNKHHNEFEIGIVRQIRKKQNQIWITINWLNEQNIHSTDASIGTLLIDITNNETKELIKKLEEFSRKLCTRLSPSSSQS